VGVSNRLFGEESDVLDSGNFRLLLLANIVYPYGTTFIAPLLESLVGPFGTTPDRIGLILTAFYAPSIVLAPFAGAITDRIGRKPVLVGSLTLFGVAGMAIASTTSFPVVLGLRFLQGTGAAGLLPVVVTAIGDLYDGNRGVTAQGLRTTIHSVSAAVAPFVAGVLILSGWRSPFLLYGVAVGIALVVWLRFEEPATAASDDGPMPSLDAVRNLFRTRYIPAAVLGFTLPSVVFVAFLTHSSFIVARGTGGTAQQAALLVSVSTAMGAAAASQTGRFVSATGSMTGPLLVAHLTAGLGLVAVALAQTLPVAVGGTVVFGSGFGLSMSLYRSVLTSMAPEFMRGTLISIGEAVRNAGATGTPLLLGLLVSLGTPEIGLVPSVRGSTAVVGLVAAVLGVACVAITRPELPNS
jgi:MFS family permease